MATQHLSITRFFKGKFFSLLENALNINSSSVSHEHSGYTFIKKTDAINFRPSSAAGIYTDSKGEKVFIKDYTYTLKNLDYEYLHNEINTLKVLNSKSLEHSKVRVPRLIYEEDKNRRITVVTEYIDGKTIDHVSQKQIQQVLIDAITFLQKQSFMIPAHQLKMIPRRLQFYTFITYPFNLARAILKEPSKAAFFLKASMPFFRYAPFCVFQKVPYGICHRDLSAYNIIFDKYKKRSVIIDTECMVRADILYDVALLPRLYVRHLKPDQLLSIFRTLNLSRRDTQRLILLMVACCITKIASEQKNARDYLKAVEGLSLSVNTLIPSLEQDL